MTRLLRTGSMSARERLPDAGTPVHRLSSRKSAPLHQSQSPTYSAEAQQDPLTESERRRIERAFYKAGSLNTPNAVDTLFLALGQRLTETDMARWFPRMADESAGDGDDDCGTSFRASRAPVTLPEVLDMMRRKKTEHLAFVRDEEESLSTFVSLGGNVDKSGTADITELIRSVLLLRLSPSDPTHHLQHQRPLGGGLRSTAVTTGASASHTSAERTMSFLERRPPAVGTASISSLAAAVTAGEEQGTVSEARDSDDTNEDDDWTPMPSAKGAAVSPQDTALLASLRAIQRVVDYAAFLDATQALRAIASSGRQAPVSGGVVSGSPSDADLKPLNAQAMAMAAGAPLLSPHAQQQSCAANVGPGFLFSSTVDNLSTNAGGAPAVGGHRPRALAVAAGVAPLNRSIREDDEWSNDDPLELPHNLQGTGANGEPSLEMSFLRVDDPTPSSAKLLRSMDRTLRSFASRRSANTPDSLLERLCVPRTANGAEPLSPDGMAYSEVLASRKHKAMRTRPVTPVMELRERAKQQVLVMEAEDLIQRQLALALQKQQHQQQSKKATRDGGSSANNLARTTARDGAGREDTAAEDERRRLAQLPVHERLFAAARQSGNPANDFVEKLADHVHYLERVATRPTSAGSAASVARLKASRTVNRRRNSVDAVQAARENALELELRRLPTEADTGADAARLAGDAPAVAPALSSFERPRPHSALQSRVPGGRRSPFLAYPQAGVFRNVLVLPD